MAVMTRVNPHLQAQATNVYERFYKKCGVFNINMANERETIKVKRNKYSEDQWS